MVYKAIVSATNKPDKNTSECLNFFSKAVIETRTDILDTKKTLIAKDCLNTSRN